MQLSKSDFTTYLKHPAWLWLKKHQKHILPEPTPALQALFDAGNKFEAFVEQQFPDAVALGFDNYTEYRNLPERTQAALDNGAQTLFQGRFEHGDLTCIIDVLQRVEGDTFDLFEIKASTRAKPEHVPDLAFQKIVLEGAGVAIRNLGVIHVNNEYVRNGEIDPSAISEITDVTSKVNERHDQTMQEIDSALEVMNSSEMPNPSPRYANDFSDWMEIYEKLKGPFEKGSIFDLAGIKPDQVAYLENAGVSLIKDIPSDMELHRQQPKQVAVTKSGERVIDHDQIGAFLGELQYPLYFLDYETYADVIPVFDGQRPYQQIPFQYSLHILREPGGALEHKDYLHAERSNPIEPLAEQLKTDIGEEGSIIVWYAPFETGRNRDMAAMLPNYAAFMEDINARTVDLMEPFKAGWFVDKDFLGSASIKKVLPVLVPGLTYEGMDIASGDVAQLAWMDAVIRDKNPGNREQSLKALRKYCELDTLAMVKIFEVLEETVRDTGTTKASTTAAETGFFSKMVRRVVGG